MSLKDGIKQLEVQVRGGGTWTPQNPQNFLETCDWYDENNSLHGYLAQNLSSYFACDRNISEDLGAMDIFVYDDDTGKRIKKHPIELLLRNPNPWQTGMDFVQNLISHKNGYGNGYAFIQRNKAGDPIALWPLDPSNTTQWINYYTADMWYTTTFLYKPLTLAPQDIIHVHGPGWNGIKGHGLLSLARLSIKRGLASQQFSISFLDNQCAPSGVLEVQGKMDPEQLKALSERFEKMFTGSRKAGKIPALQFGTKFVPTTINPNDAQLVELEKFNLLDIARYFRMPPSLIQDLSANTYSTSEQEALNYQKFTLTAHAVGLERELDRKLLGEDSGLCTELDFNNLLRGDAQTVAQVCQTNFLSGVWSINDGREFQGLPPVDGGDVHYRPANIIDINAPEPEPTPPATPQDAQDAAKQNPQAQPKVDGQRLLRTCIDTALNRLIDCELDKQKRGKFVPSEHRKFIETYFYFVESDETRQAIADEHMKLKDKLNDVNKKELAEFYFNMIVKDIHNG